MFKKNLYLVITPTIQGGDLQRLTRHKAARLERRGYIIIEW